MSKVREFTDDSKTFLERAVTSCAWLFAKMWLKCHYRPIGMLQWIGLTHSGLESCCITGPTSLFAVCRFGTVSRLSSAIVIKRFTSLRTLKPKAQWLYFVACCYCCFSYVYNNVLSCVYPPKPVVGSIVNCISYCILMRVILCVLMLVFHWYQTKERYIIRDIIIFCS